MNAKEMIRRLEGKRNLAIGETDLAALLDESKALRVETPAGVSPIRVLAAAGAVLVQETSDRGKILVRLFGDREEADRFVDRRLDTYDRMWDGCGCKVDYDE